MSTCTFFFYYVLSTCEVIGYSIYIYDYLCRFRVLWYAWVMLLACPHFGYPAGSTKKNFSDIYVCMDIVLFKKGLKT